MRSRTSVMAAVTLLFIMAGAVSVHGLNVQTDKIVYRPGERVVVSGRSEGPSRWVSVEVRGPSGELIYVNMVRVGAGGRFNVTFTLPGSSKPGNYTVYLYVDGERGRVGFRVSGPPIEGGGSEPPEPVELNVSLSGGGHSSYSGGLGPLATLAIIVVMIGLGALIVLSLASKEAEEGG